MTDIHLARPRKVARTVRMFMPCKWVPGGRRDEQQAPGVCYTDKLVVDGNTVIHSMELTIDAWSVPAAQAGDYGKVAKALAENLTTIFAREKSGKVRAPPGRKRSLPIGQISTGLGWAWWIWIVLMLLGAIARTVQTSH
jgi:hypothetical protein